MTYVFEKSYIELKQNNEQSRGQESPLKSASYMKEGDQMFEKRKAGKAKNLDT